RSLYILNSIGAQFAWDGPAREIYVGEIRSMANQVKSQILNDEISWRQAAQLAQEKRNIIMELSRTKTSPIGRAIAEDLKKTEKP
ncbi:MAG: hypothetical protein AAFP10_08820, partial [Pseudomonadota bacterium]